MRVKNKFYFSVTFLYPSSCPFCMEEDRLKNAEFLLTQTYPAIQDPKLLLSVLDLIFKFTDNLLNSFLEDEYKYKHIPSCTKEFEGKLKLMKDHLMTKYEISQSLMTDLESLNRMRIASKQSLASITDKYVVFRGQESESLTQNKAKHLLKCARELEKVVNDSRRGI